MVKRLHREAERKEEENLNRILKGEDICILGSS
jgi:hypothetical protein